MRKEGWKRECDWFVRVAIYTEGLFALSLALSPRVSGAAGSLRERDEALLRLRGSLTLGSLSEVAGDRERLCSDQPA